MPESPSDIRGLITDYRPIEVDDIPWVLSLAYERYRPFDPGVTLTWLVRVVRSPDALAIRTDHAFLIASIVKGVWQPKERDCHVIFLCTAGDRHVWEAVRLVKQSVTWARGTGCQKIWFSSETNFSLDAIAKRVGAELRVTRYCLDLYGEH